MARNTGGYMCVCMLVHVRAYTSTGALIYSVRGIDQGCV